MFFEGSKQGLGVQFYERIDEAKTKIELNPEGFQKIYRDMRYINLEAIQGMGLVLPHSG